MLGALSLKWKWRERREGAGKDTTGRTSCSAATCTSCGRSSAATSTSSRASSRSSPTSTRSAPRTSSPYVDENTIGVAAVLGTTFTGHSDDIVGIDALLVRLRDERGLDVPLHVDGASGGFVWPFLYPDSRVGLPARAGPLDQRLRAQVRARVPRHRLADLPRAQRPGRGPRLLRELPRQDRRDVHAELLDRLGDGARPVLQLRPLRPRRLPLHHGDDAAERPLAGRADRRHRPLRAGRRRSAEQLPLVAFKLAEERDTTSSTSPRSSPPSAAGWCPPTRCRRTPTT